MELILKTATTKIILAKFLGGKLTLWRRGKHPLHPRAPIDKTLFINLPQMSSFHNNKLSDAKRSIFPALVLIIQMGKVATLNPLSVTVVKSHNFSNTEALPSEISFILFL